MPKPRLPARVFYGVILAGVLLGATAFALGSWFYLERGDAVGRFWGDSSRGLVIPISAMMGTTFGGLAGFAAAVVWERRR